MNVNRAISLRATVLFLLVVFIESVSCRAQEGFTPIAIGEETSGTLTPTIPVAVYTFDGTGGQFIDIKLDFETRAFPVKLSLLSPTGTELISNQGVNYPQFQGAYLYQELPNSGAFEVWVESSGISEPTDFTLTVRERGGDEEIDFMELGDRVTGLLAPQGDYDIYLVELIAGTTILINAASPGGILDPRLLVLNTNNEVLAFNYDFNGAAPALLFTAERDGVYAIAIQGQYGDAVGPYALSVHDVVPYGFPFRVTDRIDDPGDARAFSVDVFPDETYNFQSVGQDGFQTLLLLVEESMNVIAWNRPEEDSTTAVIPGFTPFPDQRLYLIVLGNTAEAMGRFECIAELEGDEPDDIEIVLGGEFETVLGPIGDVDSFTVVVEAEKKYSIRAWPMWHLVDPAIRVLDNKGNEIFADDDSVDGVEALLSNVEFPESGTYRIEVFASPEQPNPQLLTGTVSVEFTEGAPFDLYPPLIREWEISTGGSAEGLQIIIPLDAVQDDTFPLSATATVDRTQESVVFEMLAEQSVLVEIDALPDDIVFLEATDSADTPNTGRSVAVPPPSLVANIVGMPLGILTADAATFYIIDASEGEILRVSTDGDVEVFAEGLESGGGTLGPNALAMDIDGNLYVSNALTQEILKYTPDGERQVFASGMAFPVDLTFDESQTLYVAQTITDTVDKYYPDGTHELFVQGIRNPSGLAFSPDGGLYVCNDDRGRSGIYRILEDGTPEPFVAELTETLDAIVFDRDGFLYAVDGLLGLVYRIGPDKEVVVLTRGLSGPVDLAYGAGTHSKTIFATVMGTVAGTLYGQQLIGIPTGRVGLTQPGTPVGEWWIH